MSQKPQTMKPIFPNKGVEVAYRKALREILNELHADVISEIVAEYSHYSSEIAQDINVSLMLQRLFGRLSTYWQRRLDALAPEVAKIFAKGATQHTERAMMQALKKAGFAVRFTLTERSEEAYQAVIGENVGLIKSIGSKYLEDVQQAVWLSVKSGHDLHTLSKTLSDKYGISKRRADLIARDQNNKAKAVIERERRLELGITEAIWQHSHAGKVPRKSHKDMDGKAFEIVKGMWDSSAQQFIQPGELINCRCTSRAIIPGFNS